MTHFLKFYGFLKPACVGAFQGRVCDMTQFDKKVCHITQFFAVLLAYPQYLRQKADFIGGCD